MDKGYKRFLLLARHLWLDADDARRALGPHALQQVENLVRESETRHSGEICVCVEASLPLSYLWRHVRERLPMDEVVRERALSLFGKLRVWDTELNNGVLIYLQLAEHRIDIVADRGLARHVPESQWQAVVAGMGTDFRGGRYEDGLARAIDAVSAALALHFPLESPEGAVRENRIPDRPVVR